MSRSNSGNYLLECARLLYWIYFKPFTLEQWLKDIHPDLEPRDNPYIKLKQFPNNKFLRRYVNQVFWITALTPQLAFLLVSLIAIAITQESLNWLIGEMLCLGWIIGQIICRFGYGFFGQRFLFISLGCIIPIFIIPQLLEGMALGVTLGMAGSVALGVALGVAVSVAVGATLGVAVGVAGKMAFGVALGVTLGVTLGMAGSVAFGVALGMAGSVAFGMAGRIAGRMAGSMVLGVAFGVAFGMTWIFGVLRVYFWLPELLWMGLLYLFTRQGKVYRKLRYLPPYFDQLIHLPLPFMSKILLEAYREQPQIAQNTIKYLINSTNQKQVAAETIVNIALDSLNRCQNLRDIISITQELAWIPKPTPPEIATVLPQFLDLSRTVESADLATSVYRKVEILQRPINSLTQMQTSFAFLKNPRVANLSGQIAQKWLGILQTAKNDLEKEPLYAQEIPQVYIAGAPLNPEDAQTRFKGRKDLFREIENIALMSPPPTLLLYGGRRTGKTSTLSYLPQKVGGDLIPLQVDLQGAAAAETSYGVAKFIVGQIIESARKSRNLTFNPPNQEDLRADPFFTLQEWFIDLEKRISGKKFLLCLDEYEVLEKIITATNSRASLNFLRHIIQHRPAWILLFSGSHTLDEIADYWSDYLISTRYVRISFLEKPEAVKLITQPIPNFPNIYLPEAVERIIYWTNCQPYLVQLLCSELVDYLNRKYPQNNLQVKATAQDIENIIPKALEVGSAYFNEFWDNSLNAPEREFIRNLINNAEAMEKAPVVGNKLIDKDILKLDDSNQVHFRVPLIERSFTQKIEQES